MTIPQDPEIPLEPPNPGGPTDSPPEVPETHEPDYRAPGQGDAPFRLPRENPDADTEI